MAKVMNPAPTSPQTSVAMNALFVSADLAPLEAFEFGHFFGAVFLIPATPDERVGGKIYVGDFLKSEEGPGSHLTSRARIQCQIDELRHHPHALFAGEDAAIGNVAARTVANAI